MPTNRQTDPYGGRFARDASSSGVLAGYQQAVGKLDKSLIRRNIAPYKKYGFSQSLSGLAGMGDQERYDMAAKAVIGKYKAGLKGSTGSGNGNGGGNSGGGKPAPSKPAPSKPKPAERKPSKPKGPSPADKARKKAAAEIARRTAAALEEIRRKKAARDAADREATRVGKSRDKQPHVAPKPKPHVPPKQKPKPTPPKAGAGGRARPE